MSGDRRDILLQECEGAGFGRLILDEPASGHLLDDNSRYVSVIGGRLLFALIIETLDSKVV